MREGCPRPSGLDVGLDSPRTACRRTADDLPGCPGRVRGYDRRSRARIPSRCPSRSRVACSRWARAAMMAWSRRASRTGHAWGASRSVSAEHSEQVVVGMRSWAMVGPFCLKGGVDGFGAHRETIPKDGKEHTVHADHDEIMVGAGFGVGCDDHA